MTRFLNELSFYLFNLRQNFANKQTLTASFILQIIAMFIGNSSFFVIWVLFSKAVGTINGWGPLQSFGMISVAVLIYGIVNTLFGSIMFWHERIPTGAFDTFLTKPKSLYVRIINHDFTVSGIGDLLQGIVGIAIFIYLSDTSLHATLLFLAMLIPASLMQLSFVMICNCVVFWLPQAQNLTAALTNLILLPATQPISLLEGPMRIIYLFVIPALLISGLPIETFMHASWPLFFLAYAIALLWFLLSCWILKVSITRYESGNIIG